MIEKMQRLLRDEEGATMVEYALLVTVVTLAALVGAKALGTAVNTKFTNLATEVAK